MLNLYAKTKNHTFLNILSNSTIIFTKTCVSEKSFSINESSPHKIRIAKPGPGNGCLLTSSSGTPKLRPNCRTYVIIYTICN